MAHADAARAVRFVANSPSRGNGGKREALDGVEDGEKRLAVGVRGQVAEQLVAAPDLDQRRVFQNDVNDLFARLVVRENRNRDFFRQVEIVGENDQVGTCFLGALHPVALPHTETARFVIARANLAVRTMSENAGWMGRVTAGDSHGLVLELGMVKQGDLDEVAIHVDVRVYALLSGFVYVTWNEEAYELEARSLHHIALSPTPAARS